MRFNRDNQSLPVPADLLVVKEATHIDTQRLVFQHRHPAPDINTLWTIPGWRCLKFHKQKWCNVIKQAKMRIVIILCMPTMKPVVYFMRSPVLHMNTSNETGWDAVSMLSWFCLICEIIKDLSLSSTESRSWVIVDWTTILSTAVWNCEAALVLAKSWTWLEQISAKWTASPDLAHHPEELLVDLLLLLPLKLLHLHPDKHHPEICRTKKE